VELRFSNGINILLGKNGTGKTTLLNLISMIVRSDLSELANEPFKIEFDLTFDEGEVQAIIQNHEIPAPPQVSDMLPRSFEATGDVRVFDSGGTLRCEARAKGGQAEIRQAHEPESKTVELGTFTATSRRFLRILMAQMEGAIRWPAGLWENAYRFDEALGMYEFITRDESTRLSMHVSTGHSRVRLGFEPPGLRKTAMQAIRQNAGYVVIDKSTLPFLKDLSQQMGFDSIGLTVSLMSRSPNPNYDRVLFSNPRFSFVHAGGELIPQEWLSYGQKRLLSFIYYLACDPPVVIADELVNGLHHSWIEFCMAQLGERQAFLTSQNPLLFDYVPFHSPEEVKERFVLCSLEPAQDSRPRMRWYQISDEQAVAFYDAYDADIEHVGEILRTRGLW
jgi:energy-coupling factor transporter ATP-binding protein EcfA2